MPRQKELFSLILKSFHQQKDFNAFLCQKLAFKGRQWTFGQFLYKYFYDQFQPFVFWIKDSPEITDPAEKSLSKKIRFLFENDLIRPLSVFQKIESGTLPDLDIFDGQREKETFYENLFAGARFSLPGNHCYWPPVSRVQTRFIEIRLSQTGMNETQIRNLMIHCENQREKLISYYRGHIPKCFIHNSRRSPDQLTDGCIRIHPRADDQFLNLQKFCFIGEPDAFHSGLPLQDKEINFYAWPKFRQTVVAFNMSSAQALEKITDSYNYKIDMRQKKALYPVIPLWGDKPCEWISRTDLKYHKHPRRETFDDLLSLGKKIYIIPDRSFWKKRIQNQSDLTPKAAASYLDSLARKFPQDVIRLGLAFTRQLSGK